MANNPYVNRVDYGGNTLIDLTADTVAADKLLSGYTAHDRSGAAITGSIQSKAAQTYTPGTASQTVPGGVYLSGDQTVAGDANLVAGNIPGAPESGVRWMTNDAVNLCNNLLGALAALGLYAIHH